MIGAVVEHLRDGLGVGVRGRGFGRGVRKRRVVVIGTVGLLLGEENVPEQVREPRVGTF